MDDLLKQFIINNKLLLTLTAIVFAPPGIIAFIVSLRRRAAPPPVAVPADAERIAKLEQTIVDMGEEMARLRDEQRFLTAILDKREALPTKGSV
jgi:hypothetical protein